MKVDFWLLSRDPAERVVAMIAERVLGDGGRVLVISGDAAQRESVSATLWEARPEAFLANGQSGGAHDADQPILIGEACVSTNAATACILADGRWRAEALAGERFERVFLLFGEEQRDTARTAWREVSATDGLERSFFEQKDGRWVKVA